MEQNLEVQKLTAGQKFKYFFTKPGELFKEYIEKPKFGLMFAVLGVITAIYTFVTNYVSKDLMDKILNENFKNVDPQTAEMSKKILSVSTHPALQIFFGLVGLYIGIILVSLIYLGLVKAFKGKINFIQTVAVYSLACLTQGIGRIFKSIYMLISGKPIGVESALHPTVSSTIFSMVDVFAIWYILFLIIGLSTVSGISKKKSGIIVAIVFIANILYKLSLLKLA